MTARRLPLLLLFGAIAATGLRAQGFWYQQLTPSTNELHHIYFFNKNNGWAVGAGGILLRTTNGGTNWAKTLVPPTNRTLRGVYFINTLEGFACGDGGTFLKTVNGGVNWAAAGSLPPNDYYSVYFSDAQHGWLAGSDGSVARTSNGGTSWNVIHSSSNITLYGIIRLAGSPPVVYFCGSSGTVKKSTDEGANWTSISIPGTNDLRGLAFLSVNFGYLAGRDTVYKTTDGGASWTPLPSGTMGQLTGITFVSQTTGWTIVSGSNIPYTESGGTGWTVQTSPSSSAMNGICSFTKDYAWACGANGDIIKFTHFPPQISSDPELDFGSLLCEPDNYRTLYVKNVGQGPLDIFSMEIMSAGPDKFEFAISSPSTFPFTIAPNDSVGVLIHWKPFAIGPKSAYLEITSNDLPRTPWDVPFTAQKDSTSFSFSVGSLNYTPTCVGESRDQSLDLRAEGTVSLQIVSIDKISGSDEFSVYAPSLPVSVAPGSHMPISIRFTPGSAGPHGAEFQVRTVPCDRLGTFTVTGIGLETRIVPLPDQAALGSVIVGKTATRIVTLTNPGTTSANVTGLFIDPPVPGLTIENGPPVPFRMNPGEQKTLTIRFAPADTLLIASDLVIVWDNVCAGEKRVPITGQSIVQPRILIPPILTFRPLLCEASTTDTFHIVNTGNGPLVISKFELSGKDAANFRVIDPLPPTVVDTGATLELVLQFSCADPGDKGAVLRILHNDPVNNPTDVVLSGRKDNVGFAIVADSAAPMSVCVGHSTRRSFTLLNTSSVPLRIDDIIPSNGGAPFSLSGITTPETIQPGDSRIVDLDFHPSIPGEYLNAYTVKGDKCGAQHTLLVRGIGMKAEFTTSAPIDFGYVTIGGSVTQNVAVTNDGNVRGVVEALFFNPPVPGLTLSPPPPVPFTIDSGGVQSFPIRFAPVADSVYATELVFLLSRECPDTLRIPIDAAGTSASLIADKSAWGAELPACEPGERCDTLRLRNQGINPVTVTRIALMQAGIAFRLPASTPTPVQVAAGGELQIPFCVSMPAAGSDSARLIVESTDTRHPVFTFPLSAHRDSAAIQYSTDRLDFGVLAQCDTARVLGVTIRNSGTQADTITVDPPADPFLTLVGPARRAIPGGGTEQILFRFAPLSGGTYAATARMISARCPVSRSIDMTGAKARLLPAALPDTLAFPDTPVGSTASGNSALVNGTAVPLRIDSIRFEPPSEKFSTPGPLPLDLAPGATLPLPVEFSPDSSRLFSGEAILFVSGPCRDTLRIRLQGRGVKGDLVFQTTALAFDSTAQCLVRTDSVVCRNTGGIPVTILLSTLAGANPAAFSILNPTTAPEVLAPGGTRVYAVTFNPASAPDGPVNALLRLDLSGVSPGSRELPLTGIRVTQLLPQIPAMDFGPVQVGASRSLPVAVANNGTVRFCIARVSLPAGFSTAQTFPLCLAPRDSASFDMLFAPQDTLPFAGSMILSVDAPCADSIVVSLAGRGTPGSVAQTAALDFGILPRCLAARDTVIIRNAGTQSILLAALSLTGPDSAAFALVSPPPLPAALAAGDSLVLPVECLPGQAPEGAISADLNARFSGSVTLSLATRLRAAVTTPRILAGGIQFPPTVTGAFSVQGVLLRNLSRTPLTVTGFAPGDTLFALDASNPPLPWIVPPEDSITVQVRFRPDRTGFISTSLRISVAAPCPSSADTMLSGEGIPPARIAASLRMETLHGKPDDIVDIPILLDTDVGAAAVNGYEGDVQFNRTMLYPVEARSDQTLSADMSLQMRYDQAAGSVHISAAGGAVRQGLGRLFLLRCKVLIGNALETALEFSPQFDFTGGNARVAARTPGLFQLEGYCNAGNRILRIGGNYILSQNRPNPFNPSTQIDYEVADDGYVTISVHDSFGRKVCDLVAGLVAAGRHTVEFRAEGLASGVYYYSIRTSRFSAVRAMLLAR